MQKNFKLFAYACFAGVASLIGFERAAQAQPCLLNFPPGGLAASVNIYSPWCITNSSVIGDTNAADDPSYFIDQVTTGSTQVPAGTYLGWCLDFDDFINGYFTSYSTKLFSSCDPNLDAELHALGLGYPGDVYVDPQVWNQINYILNHKNGAYFNDIQIAIWNLIGGPGSEQLILEGVPPPDNPPYNTNEVNALLLAASNNAASWQVECGDVIGVIVAVLSTSEYNPVQLTMIEVPYPCVLGCYTSLAAADAAALGAASDTNNCNGTPNLTVSDNGQYCPATITVTGVNACGNSITAIYTATVLTTIPTLIGLPAATASVSCYADVPAPPVVTATDSCGNALTVVATCTPNFPNGTSCNGTIVRTWTAMDCANQIATFTQTITVQNNSLPALTTGSIANCYGSLASADAAALAATSGTADCGGTVNFMVSDNHQNCPATITVTGTDTCGRKATVPYWTEILTAVPTLTGVPPSTTVQCVSEIPGAPTVTASDSCGRTLTVTTNQTQSNPTSTCSNVITRTWSATDCLGQTTTGTQVITQYNNAAPTVTCPPDVTVVTNFCRMYCTFGPGDWGGACNGGYYNNNWWQNWCSQNSSSQCSSSWNNWWSSCGGNSQKNNWWSGFSSCRPTGWCSGWSGGNQQGNWNGGWNNYNQGSQQWVPCNGNNPDTILNNCFSGIYSGGSCAIGLPTGGYCVTFTSAGAARNCLNLTGNCGVLSCSAVNPNTCSAGTFCAQVLALKLNCDFGDSGGDNGYLGRCGDLVLNCPSSACNGKKVRDILGICNTVLGGGACPPGCTVRGLCTLCSNLNGCFKGCQVSGWCSTNLCSVYIPPVSQTGTATLSGGCSAAQLTNYDTVTCSSCPGTYLVSRMWVAIDGCGNSNSCTQLITVSQTNSASLSGSVVLACSGDSNLSNNEGMTNVTVTLKDSNGNTVATTTTSSSGSYSFSGLALGTYTVVVTPPAGYTETYPASSGNATTVTLTACEGLTGVNFAYIGSTPGVLIIKTGPCTVTNKQTITYTFAVTNTGNTCETLTVVDPLLGGTIFTQTSVAPGQGFIFTANYVVAQTSGCLTNTASAIGTPPTGKPVTNTSSTVACVTTKCTTRSICGNFNSQNPNGGYVWCNAHVSCNPGKKCTVYCQNASVTLTCNDGKTYTFPVPDCQINFSPSCTAGSCSFNGGKWTTTLPCNGDDEIFLSGCGIPWQSDFANCHQVCWTGTFCSDTPGTSCNWQWSAACYNCDLSNCGSVGVKPCHQTQCGYPGGDHAGTPENCKSSCQGGACGGGGSNYTGSWSGTDSFTCN